MQRESTQSELGLSRPSTEPTLRQLECICETRGYSLKIVQYNGRAVPVLGEAA